MQTITQGRYTATIRKNSDSFLVLITRDGACLPGVPSRSYADAKRAATSARKMLAKVAA